MLFEPHRTAQGCSLPLKDAENDFAQVDLGSNPPLQEPIPFSTARADPTYHYETRKLCCGTTGEQSRRPLNGEELKLLHSLCPLSPPNDK
jgi:hypothetical protein